MFTSTTVVDRLKNLLGWRQHYDATEIVIDPSLTVSETGEYYQDFHPALRLDIIKAIIPENRDLDDYLTEKIEAGITGLLGDVVSQKQYEQYARRTLAKHTLIDKYGWVNDVVINTGRFIGFKIKPTFETGLTTIIKRIGLQLTQAQNLTMYLYHSSKIDPVETFTVSVTKGIQWNWNETELNLYADGLEITGGVWILGYYQDDLIGNAISYTGLNFINGPCSTCDGGSGLLKWRELMRFVQIVPFYVAGSDLNGTQMFDMSDTIEVFDNNFGMNLNISNECDLTDFFIEQRFSLKKGLGLKVAYLILKDIMFSQQINYIEESLKSLVIRDLEGDKDTNYVNIADQLANEIKAINFDHSRKSAYCLPCNNSKGVTYGSI